MHIYDIHIHKYGIDSCITRVLCVTSGSTAFYELNALVHLENKVVRQLFKVVQRCFTVVRQLFKVDRQISTVVLQ